MHETVIADTAVYRNALPPGTALMEYRLEGVLGAGGFGLTYVAWDAHLQKRVAIKEYLPADIALRALDGSVVPVATQRQDDYRWGLERFLQEARTLARFSHPHIVRVNRYFEANNTAYMVMDYEHGESMSRFLKREPRPPEEKLREILLPLLDGLRAVHEAGFLHRDIKPGNIFIREQGGPVLLDFGAARHAVGGSGNHTALLTPGYAPIEQYSAEAKQGPWADIYAVAGVFFRAVTNANPPDAVARMRADAVPDALTAARDRYGASLLAAIGWGLEPEECRRPQSVAEWQEGLLGRVPIPYESHAGPLPPADAPTRRLTAGTAQRQWLSNASGRRYGWTLAAIAGLAVVAWLALSRPASREQPPMATPVAPPPAPPVAEKVADPPAPRHKPKPAHKPARIEQRPTPRPAPAPVAESEPPEVAVAAEEPAVEEGRAPVRDAIALPPLPDVTRERPSRERSPRPGSGR